MDIKCVSCDRRLDVNVPQSFEQGHGACAIELHHVHCPDCGAELFTVQDFGVLNGIGHTKKKNKPRAAAHITGVNMKCHLVTLKGKCERYAGTGADAKVFRQAIMDEFGITNKKAVIIEPAEIPTQKDDLLEFMNDLLTRIDGQTAAKVLHAE